MRYYTGTGDKGDTALFAGGRVPKQNLRVEAYGEVDELNSLLGWALAAVEEPRSRKVLERVQGELFELGADLATPLDAPAPKPVPRVSAAHVARLEQDADSFGKETSELKSFVLPGGSEAAARLHVCRAAARRAERRLASLAAEEKTNPEALRYVNRLSSLLFVLARWHNAKAGAAEKEWHPPGRS
jgi:cob(I)alamin adenosyltransferase